MTTIHCYVEGCREQPIWATIVPPPPWVPRGEWGEDSVWSCSAHKDGLYDAAKEWQAERWRG